MSQTISQLSVLGWDPNFEAKFKQVAAPADVPARVTADFAAEYMVHDGIANRRARARHVDPAVGDWVALDGEVIRAIVERRSVFSRRAAGVQTREQVLASNVDVAFVIASATDVNVRRVERYLTIAWQSGAAPVVVLTKADVTTSSAAMRNELEAIAAGTPVVITSSVTREGLDDITNQLYPAKTGVLLGPSGVGKSTLINAMLGADVMRTREVHRSGEGRHMTSHRQLVQLPGGGMIIDTPGLREAQLWEGDDALGAAFQDIEDLALQCRFFDCSHQTEPGCAIKAALAGGSLDPARLQSYRKLQRELRAVTAKSDARIRIEDRKKWKRITVAMRKRVRP